MLTSPKKNFLIWHHKHGYDYQIRNPNPLAEIHSCRWTIGQHFFVSSVSTYPTTQGNMLPLNVACDPRNPPHHSHVSFMPVRALLFPPVLSFSISVSGALVLCLRIYHGITTCSLGGGTRTPPAANHASKAQCTFKDFVSFHIRFLTAFWLHI